MQGLGLHVAYRGMAESSGRIRSCVAGGDKQGMTGWVMPDPPQLSIRGLLLWKLAMSCSFLPGSSPASLSSALIPTFGVLFIYSSLSVAFLDLLHVKIQPARPLMLTLAAPALADRLWERGFWVEYRVTRLA